MEVTDAVAWPFAIGGSISERLEWLTDLLEPPYGPPQTRKLRQAPRTVFNFDGLESKASRRWMETLLAANRVGLWHVPLAIDTTELGAAAAISDEVLQVETAGRRFRAGGNALLLGSNAREHEVVEIDTVDADSITLVQPLTRAWRTGAMLVPTIGARLTEAPNLGRFTGDDAPYSIAFRADEPLDWPGDLGATLYRDFPVIELPADWTSDPGFRPERLVDTLDNSIGRVRQYDLAGVLRPEIRFALTLAGRSNISAFRSLLHGLCGRWQPAWVPSLGQDVAIKAVNTSTTLDVEWMGIHEWALQGNRRDIRIERRGAAPIYRRINAAVEVNASTERLQLDAALPGGFALADVVAVSFMALSLQDSDTNLLRLWDRDVVNSEVSFKGITHAF